MKFNNLVIFLLLASFGFSQPANNWSFLGPNLFPANLSGQINGIGRVTQLKVDPNNPKKIYATSASGGLWLTTDTGSTWLNVNTDNLPNMQCASICIDHTNPNVLYLGSGDPNYYTNSYGMWKTTNAGTTWNTINTGLSSNLIIETLMHPANNQILITATNNGIYKTTNGGTNWTQVKSGGNFKSMVIKPNSLDTVYAVTDSEIWRSLNFGSTWTQITAGVSIPSGNGQGMRVAVSKASPNIVYVCMIANEGKTLKSTDFGTTFFTVYDNPAQSLVGYDATTSGQGDYNFGLNVDPNNANIVYVVAHCVWKSIDGGITWTKLTDWAVDCHTDMHGILVHPTYTNMVYNVNDGGVFVSRDAGDNWEDKSNGIGATENYHAAQSNINRNQVSIGTQDNGELFSNNTNWFTNRGGDWTSRMIYDFHSSNKVYYIGTNERRVVTGSGATFNLPYSANNNSLLAFNKKIPNIGFSALQKIYITTNLSTTSPVWVQIANPTGTIAALHSSHADSSMLYAITKNNLLYRCDNVFAGSPTFTSYPTPASTSVKANITTIKTNSNVVIISCGTGVYKSTNKGSSFIPYSTGLPASLNILNIYHDEYSTNEALYLATAFGVYYRTNAMSSWMDISYNLPSIATIEDLMIYNNGTAASVLRVAYYGRGVWELPLNISMPPSVNFTSNKQSICPGESINFFDNSFSGITSYNWNFIGGSPATSTLTNPTVSYTSSGNYPVSLTVTNANGTSTITQNNYVTVTSPNTLPIIETFTTSSFPPTNWNYYDAGNNFTNWEKSSTVGGYGLSTTCSYFDNYNNWTGDLNDGLITENYNFSTASNIKLFFDVAYAMYSSVDFDSLAVKASTNCGVTYTTVYLKGNSSLATAPNTTSFFTPNNSEWRTDTIYLNSFSGVPQIQFMFENRGGYGNVIYIDNINVTANLLTTNALKLVFKNNYNVFPNPANDKVNITFNDYAKFKVIYIQSIDGKIVYEEKLKSNIKNIVINSINFKEGVYFITLIGDENLKETKKLIIER